jgi:hypothetical protein
LGQSQQGDWYLGLDIGNTGISAVLLQVSQSRLYPLHWTDAVGKFAEDDHRGLFRLPAIARVDLHQLDPSQTELAPVLASPLGEEAVELQPTSEPTTNQSLQNLKALLSIGVPYYSRPLLQWQPVLRRLDHPLPLLAVRQSLAWLLSTIAPPPEGTGHRLGNPTPPLTCEAIGLSASEFETALANLTGVIINQSAASSDAGFANLRTAVWEAGLVDSPARVYGVNEAIAALVSGLRGAAGEVPSLPPGLSPRAQLYHEDWQGTTLVLSAGAATTELAIVLPAAGVNSPLLGATYSTSAMQETSHRSIAYAGHGLDQDIIFQLLYPAWNHATDASAVDDDPWQELLVNQVLPPSPGNPAVAQRQLISDRFQQSAFGRQVLAAARRVKLELQQRDHCTITLGERNLTILRQDLGSRVFLPYIQRLNREISLLLQQSGVALLDVQQVICTGGTASLGAIARWLRQKLPNATIIQDTYSATPNPYNCLATCSRVAYGLAMVSLHPQFMDQASYASSDYDLFLGMISVFTSMPLTVDEILQRLNQQGFSTSGAASESLRQRVLALLEGHLPTALLPTPGDTLLLTPESQDNPDYQKLQAAPLFHKLDAHTYQPNPAQWPYLLRYLEAAALATPGFNSNWRTVAADAGVLGAVG